MIIAYIYLDKNTYLFRSIKKRGILENNIDAFFIKLFHKPCIGELLELDTYSVSNECFSNYLRNRNKRVILRIDDLMSQPMESSKATVISIKAHEDKFEL